ncbi:sulfite exporter TauE/SafE family protein [Neobacillus piezotolerans]|uniref:Sulfite exporter TauE/SafE family protein n=1 Tax=Neobacillus piezotolerans TaxID=2259171 RepID=A0A3D8GPZ1_9BACI|nr:sulfite exporter TauE/SafE family protein [Neobacillus piezotolerans]RDU36498.1 sulfite exporter TauE/SafE family protein [Neobacillus piezotolerans]
MYQVLTDISNFLSTPFLSMLNSSGQLPILAAFLLGIVGALAPCQLTGNISAITFYGNKSVQETGQVANAVFFILGKIIVFSLLGLSVWSIGREFQDTLITFFAASRKAIGPFIILLGLFLAGVFKLGFLNKLLSFVPVVRSGGKWGSFLMGAAFSISFCPTMFILFFITLMPIVLSTSYGAFLPPIFAIGTSLPLIVFLLIISFLGIDGALLRKSRKIGFYVQKTAGIFLIMIGILDTITYWV